MNQINQKKFIFTMIIGFALILVVGSSYALLRSSQIGNNTYTMTVGNLEVTFQDERTNALTINNMVPMSDTEGLSGTDELTFVIKNTGNIPAVYNVYIEETSTSPAFKTVIRYVDKKNTGDYSSVKVLNDDKYIDKSASLAINEEATYKVKLWLSEEATTTYMNKTFKAKIVVDVLQDMGSSLLNNIYYPKNSSCNNYVKEDGITYISGSKDCIDFNYVWWSGKMWRITAIYPDGSMKLITDNSITSISYNDTLIYFDKTNNSKSYVFNWLNEDFKDTLYNQGSDVIDTTKYWNATMPADTNISTKPLETDATMIPTSISPIGMFNSYDYYKSFQNATESTGYLNIEYSWWLINSYDSTNVYHVKGNGEYGGDGAVKTYGIRPSIYLKKDITMIGNGTKSNPYKLTSDYTSANTNSALNTRNSGEYIKFSVDGSNGSYQNAPLFRIVGIEGESNSKITKIVSMDYAANKAVKQFASSNVFGANGNTESDDYWDYYLNHGWYDTLSFKNKIVSGTYYIGNVGSTTPDYKLAICNNSGIGTTNECLNDASKRVNTTFTGNVGLLRYGEMFATQQGLGSSSSIYFWLITQSGASSIRYIRYGFGNSIGFTSTNGARPTYYLKSDVKILSGSGTELNPYIVD